MTASKYREGESKRIMVAKECLSFRDRFKLPMLMVNLDGIIGYFDELKMYFIKPSNITLLIALSNNFKVIAFCQGQSKNVLRKLCKLLQDKGMVFDAVYLLRRLKKDRVNITHALLDFWDED